jgi:hypothetical protein
MVGSQALVLAALRTGLAVRRARVSRRPPPRDGRRRHLRLAKPAVVLVLIGFAAGPVSAVWLRDWTPFSSFHGVAGGIAGVLFVLASIQGRRLESGEPTARRAHALLAGGAVLAAAVAAVAGFVLLP